MPHLPNQGVGKGVQGSAALCLCGDDPRLAVSCIGMCSVGLGGTQVTRSISPWNHPSPFCLPDLRSSFTVDLPLPFLALEMKCFSPLPQPENDEDLLHQFEGQVEFSGEEMGGRCLDLHSHFQVYVNSK